MMSAKPFPIWRNAIGIWWYEYILDSTYHSQLLQYELELYAWQEIVVSLVFVIKIKINHEILSERDSMFMSSYRDYFLKSR